MVQGRQVMAQSMFKKDAQKSAAKQQQQQPAKEKEPESEEEEEEEEEEHLEHPPVEAKQLTLEDEDSETEESDDTEEAQKYDRLKDKKKQLKRELRERYKQRAKEKSRKRKRQGIDGYKEVGAADSPQKRWKRALRNSRAIATMGRDKNVPRTRLLDHRFG